MDLTLEEFAADVGTDGAVSIAGLGTRGGAVPGVRTVNGPSGIEWIQPDEMTIGCGAGTPVDEVDDALAAHGQRVALPPSGTVGGALAVGRSGIRRLGYGPCRDTVLQMRYVSAAGRIVKIGGPTVKNVSGFDMCRLLVGSRGTLGFIGDVILRTRPTARFERWYAGDDDPWSIRARLYRPVAVLWNGARTWVRLEGERSDVEQQAAAAGLAEVDGPPALPDGGRWSVPPAELAALRAEPAGSFVAEVAVGIVHHQRPAPARPVDPAVVELHRRIKRQFDPAGRLNPGIDVLAARLTVASAAVMRDSDPTVDRPTVDRPYVDRPVGDLSAATEAAAQVADALGLPRPRLLRVGMNAIFSAGDVVMRVGRPTAPASASIELAERLGAAGLRVARPVWSGGTEVGGLAVTVWERIEATGEPIDWRAVGAMVGRVHDLPPEVVPAGYPAPSPAAFEWWDFPALLAETAPAIDAAAHAGLVAAVERWPGWEAFEEVVVCHGDVHPGNVMMAADGPVLIDWDLLCRAPRGWDHAPMMTWTARWGGPPGVYEAFSDGYGWSARGDRAAEAFAELRLVAATLMRVRAAMATPPSGPVAGPDPRPEADLRLRYWRGEPGAPAWHAQ